MPGSSSVAVGSTLLIVAVGLPSVLQGARGSSEQAGSGVLGTLGSGEVDLTGGGAETRGAEMRGAETRGAEMRGAETGVETGGAGTELVAASPSPR